MRFRTKLLSAGKTAAGIEIPARVVEALGSSKKPAVSVTINGFTYRSTVAVVGGKFMVGVSGERREAAGVTPGEMLDVDIELDTQPREVDVPAEFAKALGRDAQAKKVFEGLSYSGRLRHVLPIANAKTDETRKRNIDKAIKALRETKP
ncbi:MAG: hypothetical protein QOJ10_1207 [Chloroflexota bacterium]|jgi:hypothetical protein|nr:hypothetical protein [Chloroflexota bacterium]MEA2644335.1 hypothetical protein [Chloroflexota bacterium]